MKMDIEQRPPKKPNFLLVVGLFVATILIVLLAAYLVLHHEAHEVPNGKHVRIEWKAQTPLNTSVA